MARIYATTAEYETYTGTTPAPAGTDARLADASRMLDSRVLRLCWYEVDEATGLPSHALVLAAFRDATCAQARWWVEVGDSIGAVGAGWNSVSIGSASLSRSGGGTSGDDSPARQLAPQVWDALRSPDLTPDLFRLGEVIAW